jgi:hypothetical protein
LPTPAASRRPSGLNARRDTTPAFGALTAASPRPVLHSAARPPGPGQHVHAASTQTDFKLFDAGSGGLTGGRDLITPGSGWHLEKQDSDSE